EQAIAAVFADAASGSAQLLFQILASLQHGSLRVTTPDAQHLEFPGQTAGVNATLHLNDWGVCDDILRAGDIGFAESYLQGRWQSGDLAALLTLCAQNRAVLERAIYGRWFSLLVYRLRHLLHSNTKSGSRKNIHAHYDLGNDFYQLWLDPGMTYSAALFEGDMTRTLEAAQCAKYERILNKLKVKSGEHILEIGFGWGGFAEQAARSRGARVTGITLSQNQMQFAQQRIAAAGLDSRIDFRICDYRDVSGQYDTIVSSEMIEAVGERYWPAYFKTIHDCLKPGGKAMIQAITIADDLFARYRKGSDFIQQYVFPGGMLASSGRFEEEARRAGLRVADRFAFGPDYAETLQRWHQSFAQQESQVRALGYDERFLRLWKFYLCYCEAGFRSGCTDVYQFELQRE
ncbi:MAG: class I SAM-dependent methyltransferase, partial [Burkholderiales bacterium]